MRVGFIGWRGMVGSVLMERMLAERDFDHIEPVFFTTSQAGGKGPAIGRDLPPLKDARDVRALVTNDVLISCQGGDYTNEIHPKLRSAGWKRHCFTAATAARSRSRLPLRPSIPTSTGTPAALMVADTVTVPVSPARRADAGYFGMIRLLAIREGSPSCCGRCGG